MNSLSGPNDLDGRAVGDAEDGEVVLGVLDGQAEHVAEERGRRVVLGGARAQPVQRLDLHRAPIRATARSVHSGSVARTRGSTWWAPSCSV